MFDYSWERQEARIARAEQTAAEALGRAQERTDHEVWLEQQLEQTLNALVVEVDLHHPQARSR